MSVVLERSQIVEKIRSLPEDKFISCVILHDLLNKVFHNYSIDAYPSVQPKHRKVYEKKSIHKREIETANEGLTLLLSQLGLSNVILTEVNDETNYREYIGENYYLLHTIFKAIEEVLSTTRRPSAPLDVREILLTTFSGKLEENK
jgi:hypothetical protein